MISHNLSDVFPYTSSQAFGAAITDRLKTLASQSVYTVTQLRRHFAYDRLLTRLFLSSTSEWILKGGVSMLARITEARHSADVDLVAKMDSIDTAFQALRKATSNDLGDFFSFHFQEPRLLVQGVQGIRIPTEARLGPRIFENFGIDLVTGGVAITGEPETLPPIVSIGIPGLQQTNYLSYPLTDTIADKVSAIIEQHNGRPSTRFRDLVDLVLIAHNDSVESHAVKAALNSERLRRELAIPTTLKAPDDELWRTGYARVAAYLPNIEEKSLDAALALVNEFLAPILNDQVHNEKWNPKTLKWTLIDGGGVLSN